MVGGKNVSHVAVQVQFPRLLRAKREDFKIRRRRDRAGQAEDLGKIRVRRGAHAQNEILDMNLFLKRAGGTHAQNRLYVKVAV